MTKWYVGMAMTAVWLGAALSVEAQYLPPPETVPTALVPTSPPVPAAATGDVLPAGTAPTPPVVSSGPANPPVQPGPDTLPPSISPLPPPLSPNQAAASGQLPLPDSTGQAGQPALSGQTGQPPVPPSVPPLPGIIPGSGFGPAGFGPPGDVPPEQSNAFSNNGTTPYVERNYLYANLEYLLWVFNGRSLPVLATSGNPSDPIPGARYEPGTQPLIQGSDNASNVHSGIRATLGAYLDAREIWAVEGSFFILNQTSGNLNYRSSGAFGSPAISRPFFNVNTGLQDADPIALPGVMAGGIDVQTPREFYGAEANLRYNIINSPGTMTHIDLLFGGRFLALDESLFINESLQDVGGLGTAGNSYALSEKFAALNRFYGGQFGANWQHRIGGFVLQAVGKIAFGTTQQTLNNSATAMVSDPFQTVRVQDHALLVQPSNAGYFHHSSFSVVPEVGGMVSYQFNRYLRLGAGYNFIYWTRVIHPENQIDTGVNVQPLQPFGQAGIARPEVIFHTGQFWAQGLTLNMQLSF